MTRKKWTEIRRQNPELYSFLAGFPPWERLDSCELAAVRKISARALTQILTTIRVEAALTGEDPAHVASQSAHRQKLEALLYLKATP